MVVWLLRTCLAFLYYQMVFRLCLAATQPTFSVIRDHS